MHSISAVYGGDTNYLASTSGNWAFWIVVPDFYLSAYPGTLNFSSGQTTGLSTINISPVNGFTGTVSFSCSGLPSGASCIFSPSFVTTNGSSVLTITTTKAQDGRLPVAAENKARKLLWLPAAAMVSTSLFLVIAVPRSWREFLGLCLFVPIALVITVTSCGGSGSGVSTTPPSPTLTSTVITASTSSPAKGENDTFTASVNTAGTSQPTGTVQFNVDGVASGSAVPISLSKTQLVTSFATAGPHTVAAAYSGDALNQSSLSGPFKLNVPYTSGSVPGTYQISITATSGTVSHTIPISLIIQ
jgi:hypothetical protein